MSIDFDESDDYYDISDAAELTLQDGDWCIGLWTRVDSNTGTTYKYLLSTNYGANNEITLYLREASCSGGLADQWSMRVVDGDGTSVYQTSPSSPGGDSTWRLIIIQRDDSENEVQLWFCELGASASKEISAADTNFAAVNGATWYVAARSDTDANRYYGGRVAELFKGDFALTQAQIEALAAGLPIKTLAKQLGHTLDLWLPMWEADATLLDYSGSGNSATRHSAPTTQDHPAICTPSMRRRM